MPSRPLTTAQQALAMTCYRMARSLAGPYMRRWPRARDDYESAAMLSLTRAARSFQPERGFQFTTYADHCISNALHDEYKHQKRRHSHVDTDSYQVDALIAPFDAVAAIRAADDREQVAAWLSYLPGPARELCTGVYVHGLSLPAATKRVGVSKSKGHTIHEHAKAQLKQLLCESPNE